MRTLIIRNTSKSFFVEIKTDILNSVSEILVDGYDVRFTNMYFIGYDYDEKKIISVQEIENSFNDFKARIDLVDDLDLYVYDDDQNEVKLTGLPTSAIGTPQDLSLIESVIGEVTASWTDLAESVDGYKVYRRITSVGGSWGTELASIAEGVQTYTDTTVLDSTQYDYKVTAYSGDQETIPVEFGENYQFIITLEQLTGLLFEFDNNEYLIQATQTLSAPWSVKLGIQDISIGSGSVQGLFGFGSSTTWRLYASTNSFAQNRSGLTNQNSGDIGLLDFLTRGIQEWYMESNGDVYYKSNPDATPIFLWNAEDPPVQTFPFNIIMKSGNTLNAEGYLYHMEVTNGGVTEVFDINEGSGDTVTGDLGTEWTINSNIAQPHIDDNMWVYPIPVAANFVPFTSLSTGGRPTLGIDVVLSADPLDYTPGSVDYQIASIYNVGDHNPDGWTHAIITSGTNDTANIAGWATPDEYETHLTAVVQKLKAAGVSPIIAFTGSIVTLVKQAQKDYDPTIGAYLSGDPMNPTPESEWDFNVASPGVTAILPLFVAKGMAVAAAESVPYVNTFQHFIDGQVAPYDQWITADGVHYGDTGYDEYGIAVAAVLDTLGLVGTDKVCVIGDSLGNGITDGIQQAFNS